MDGIIWKSESLQLIASRLRESSDGMEANLALLRRCRSEVPLAARDSGGTLLGNILEQTDRAIRKLTDAAERASELARAVQFTDTLFEETERDIQRLYEDIADFAEMDGTVSSGHWKAPAHIVAARGLAERAVAVPEWLSSAAEQFFRSTHF